VLIELPRAAEVYQRLLRAGVIVRPAAAWGIENGLRITVGTPDENERLIAALREVLGKGGPRA
jgi:histidinol-phosphate aminotransferase